MTRLWQFKTREYLARLVSLAVIALFLCVIPAGAQTWVEYSAKFACGVATATNNTEVQPGTYSTTINIHNPHDDNFSTQRSTTFLKKAVLSLQEGVTPPPPSGLVQENLLNDYAEEVDCAVIKKLLGITSTTFIEGYVVILVPPTANPTGGFFTNELDVVGIYTDSKGAEVVRPANEHIFAPGTS